MKCHMKTKRIFLMICLYSVLLFPLPGHAMSPSPPEWQIALCQNLNSLKGGKFLDPEIQDLHTLASVYSDSEVAMQAILEILIEETQDIDFFWWKSENRPVRCFILALIKLPYPDDYWLAASQSAIKRFREPEAQERSEELAFVLEHRSAFAGVIAEILRKRDSEKYASEFTIFKDVGKLNLGEPFPNWCQNAKD